MRKIRNLLQGFYGSCALVLPLSLCAFAVYCAHELTGLQREGAVQDLRHHALLLGNILQDKLSPEHRPEVIALLKEAGSANGTWVTLIDRSGAVLADSGFDATEKLNLARRPEVGEALMGNIGVAERLSFVTPEKMLYVAVPVRRGGEVIGVVRASVCVSALRRALQPVNTRLAFAALLTVLVGGFIGYVCALGMRRSLGALKTGADRFAGGDFLYRLEVPDSPEIARVSESLNALGDQLYLKFEAVVRQRNELEAVLFGMLEAVLAVDPEERVLRLNPAAERLFGTEETAALGRGVREIIRNTELHKFVRDTLLSGGPIERDMVFRRDAPRYVQAHGVTLKDASGSDIGVLIVLNDITRLKTLENIRRDFVANVSHELRTPVTSIKGFLETLRDGAAEDPDHRERFLDIIMKHTDRLITILDDLLALARVEEDGERGAISREECSVEDLFDALKRLCAAKAEERGIRLEFRVQPGLRFSMNRTLMEQALLNLLDNALKYSKSGGVVEVTAEGQNGEAVMRVKDYGCGIEKDHLPRLFERFYRVDKARSRKEGGTGLGLAIAKHVVSAHNGKITVESSPGEGSVFSVSVPMERSNRTCESDCSGTLNG